MNPTLLADVIAQALQWGLALSGGETDRSLTVTFDDNAFQWGPALSGGVTSQRSDTASESTDFNGASPFQAGKPRRLPARRRGELVASMGPRPFRRGNSLHTSHCLKSRVLTDEFHATSVSISQLTGPAPHHPTKTNPEKCERCKLYGTITGPLASGLTHGVLSRFHLVRADTCGCFRASA